MPLISEDVWIATKPPFYHMTISGHNWDEQQVAFVEDWADANSSGWAYVLNDNNVRTFIFEKEADMMLFHLWVTGDPFAGADAV